MALFVASDSDSGTLEYSYSSTEVQSDEDGFQKNPFLMFRKAYGPPPPPDPTDLPWSDKNEQPHAGHKSVPSHEHIVQDDMEEDENLSSYDADDSASGTFETLSTDRESRMHLDNVSELRGSYGYTTEDSELGDNPGARPSSRAGSIYSFHSSVDSHLFRDFHGRKFNTLNPVYHLPADMEEHERLSIQHRILCLFFGNLYPAGDVVEGILKAREGYTPMILDVGAGSGIWTMEMALKFPHCEVVGLDIVPPNLGNREIPPNCRFEVDDANLSLTHYANMFDLVHCRAVEMAIQDWEAFSYNIAQTLKPGGMFLSSTGNTQFLNERGEPLRVVTEGRVGFRWIQKVFSAIHEAIDKKRGSEWVAPRWHEIVEKNCNYKGATSQQLHMPVGNWLPATASPDHQYAAELLRYNFINLFKSCKPLLIARGYPETLVERWRMEAVRELLELKVKTLSAWSCMWCFRNDNPWMPVPERRN